MAFLFARLHPGSTLVGIVADCICDLYSITKNQAAIRDLFKVVETHSCCVRAKD